MSGLYAENIQNSKINKYGQMEYNNAVGQASGNQNTGGATSNRYMSSRPSPMHTVASRTNEIDECVAGSRNVCADIGVMRTGERMAQYDENFTDTDEQ